MLRGHMLVAKTRDLVESFPTAPVSSKTDPCASSYDIFKFCTLLTLLKKHSVISFYCWSLCPSRSPKMMDLVESIPTAPVSSKMNPCASSYVGFKFSAFASRLPAPYPARAPLLRPSRLSAHSRAKKRAHKTPRTRERTKVANLRLRKLFIKSSNSWNSFENV